MTDHPDVNTRLCELLHPDAELYGVYSNSGIEDRQPSPEEVVRSALVEISTDLRTDDRERFADYDARCRAEVIALISRQAKRIAELEAEVLRLRVELRRTERIDCEACVCDPDRPGCVR